MTKLSLLWAILESCSDSISDIFSIDIECLEGSTLASSYTSSVTFEIYWLLFADIG